MTCNSAEVASCMDGRYLGNYAGVSDSNKIQKPGKKLQHHLAMVRANTQHTQIFLCAVREEARPNVCTHMLPATLGLWVLLVSWRRSFGSPGLPYPPSVDATP
jgi:hypothetical protein